MMRVARKPPSPWFIGFILAFVPVAPAQEPPADLAKRVAKAETETRAARDQYTYRQTVSLEELSDRGARVGEYREVRDIVFSPENERTEQPVGAPSMNLKRLVLTPEDFRDIRDIQPFVMTEDQLWNYETSFRGEENMDEVECWVLQVRPRQILAGQRLFDGMLWVGKKDFAIVRLEGQAVPQVHTAQVGKPVPALHDLRKPVDGKHWFPIHHLRGRHAALPQRAAAHPADDPVQQL